jgi:hypothetical protein
VSLAGGAGAGKGILSAVFNDGVAGAVNFDFSATTVNGDSFVVNRTGVGGGGSAFADDTYALGNAGTVAKPEFLTIIGTGTENVAETIKFGSGLNSIFDVAHDNPTGHHYANTAATGLQSATIFSTISNSVTGAGNLDTLAFSTAPTSVAATPVLGFASVQAGIDFELGTLNLNQVGAFTVGAGTTTFVFDHAGGGAGAPLAAKDSLVAVDNFAAPLTSIGLNATTHDIQLIA